MRLGFDVDGVVANLAPLIEKFLWENFEIEWPEECFDTFRFKDCKFHGDSEINEGIIHDLSIVANDAEFQFDRK